MAEEKTEHGIRTVELDQTRPWEEFWSEFYGLICTIMSGYEKPEDHICWRGQPDGRPLLSLFDRMLEGRIPDARERRRILADHERSSSYAFRGILQNPTIRELKQAIRENHMNENHFWAIGRHYDLATPLLDWTLSPFVGAFFAFEQERAAGETRFEEELEKWSEERLERELEKCRRGKSAGPARSETDIAALREDLKRRLFPGHRFLCGLKYKELADKAGSDSRHKKELLQFDRTFAQWKRTREARWNVYHREQDKPPAAPVPCFQYFDPLSSEHKRLLNQIGVFTITADGGSMEKCVETFCPKDDESWILIRIALPTARREEFLKQLHWMNINHLSLFPDLLGASKYSNQELERALARRQP